MSEALPELLTIVEVASMLHLSQSAIRRYVRIGELHAIRVAGRTQLRFRREDVAALLVPIVASGEVK